MRCPHEWVTRGGDLDFEPHHVHGSRLLLRFDKNCKNVPVVVWIPSNGAGVWQVVLGNISSAFINQSE